MGLDQFTCIIGENYQKTCPTKKQTPCCECHYKDEKIPERKIFEKKEEDYDEDYGIGMIDIFGWTRGVC